MFLPSPAATRTLLTTIFCTVSEIVCVPVTLPLLAVKTTGKTPNSVGVPDITPVEAFRLKPAGKPVAVKLLSGLLLMV